MENLKNLHTQALKNKQRGIRNVIKMLGDNADATDMRRNLTREYNAICTELFIRLQEGTY